MVTQADLTATEGRLGTRIDGGFEAVNTRLDTLNGSVRHNTVDVALLKAEQEHHAEDITDLKTKVSALVMSAAKKVGTVAILGSVAGVVVVLIQYVLAPLIQHLIEGGGTP